MTLDPLLIKVYQCLTWSEGDTHGGGISAVEIVDGVLENVFDNVQSDEKPSTEFRKIYFKNENDQEWPDVLVWISQFTLFSEDEIWICVDQATFTDTQAEASSYTYYQPDSKSHTDCKHPNVYNDAGELQNSLGNVPAGCCFPVWLKRVVNDTDLGFTDNSAKIKCG